ncbi:SpaA isopeptide-forming pilin-related protein [Levilactobacillus fujinensis]|uniref:SpaA isopeptide-forming pilin-related protein n=1 Tax=Levilactobacillus fujinensis TaxID=2486024 RepID=A0ABW1TDU2_9LACO
MRKKITAVVMGILIAIVVCLIGGLGAGTVTAHASEIAVSGLGENDAVITDSNGKVIPNGSDLSKWDNYTVEYTWGIPDGVTIQDGDTATVTFPNSAVGRRDVTFPLFDDNGEKIGTFTIKEGESTGTITFNGALTNTATNRKGHLQFYVKGSTDNNTVGLDWGINKVGWVSERNEDGSPAKLTWNIAFNPNSTNLGQTVITDNFGASQTYVPGSVHAATGTYDESGNFVGDGGTLTPSVDVGNSMLIFSFENVTTAVDMTYQTIPDVSGTGGSWSNNASLNGQNVSARIVWGGTGSGNGDGGGGSDQKTGEVILTKTDKANGDALAGAVYELQTASGEVVKSDLVTDANGNIKYDSLATGDYQFVETKAPEGYDLNKTPISFTIKEGTTAAVTVSAEDVKEDSSTTNPGNPGTTTPPTNPGNPGTTTPPTNPGNPGTTTPPTNPGNPGTTTPPTNPGNPGTTTPPTNPGNPGTTTPPTNPGNPGTTTPGTTPSIKPPKPTTPTKPSTLTTGSGNGNSTTTQPSVTTGGSAGYGAGQTSGGTTGAAGSNGQSTGTVYTGSTLPQTGERRTTSVIYTIVGIALLLTASGFGYVWLRKH